MERKTAWNEYKKKDMKKLEKLNAGYRAFLDHGKTERECVKESVRQAEIVFEKSARAIWSNIPNAAMDNFYQVTTEHYDEFMNEKAVYIDYLKQRSEIFKTEAEACSLPCYPYKEGFFVTIQIEDNGRRDRYHELLLANNIFTVKVNHGIRVAACSLSIDKCKGLAARMKQYLDETK